MAGLVHPDVMLTISPAPSSVGDLAYRRLRADIVFARLAPGQRLKLEEMRALYGAGVSTLREILNRLAAEHLVEAEGLKGFRVSPVSAQDLREVAALRLLLEGHAMAQSFAAGDMDWEGRVVAAHHKLGQLERRMLKGELAQTEAWKRYDFEFHHALVSACGSQALLATHAGVYDRYLRYQMVAGLFRGEAAVKEHAALLEAALRRDASEAGAILRRHIEDCIAEIAARSAFSQGTVP